MKKILLELKENAGNNLNTYDPTCHQCWHSIYALDDNCISSYISRKDRPIKRSYDDIVLPLQNLLLLMYHVNLFSMVSIFKEPFLLFCLSTFLSVMNVFIQSELFTAVAPNVYCTIAVSGCIFLFSIFLLLKMMVTLLTIIHYGIMKTIFTSE